MMSAWQARRDETRFGRAMSRFHRFCDCLDSHSSLLNILPRGSEYVSLFTGSLEAVIKASVNHERIAEDVSSALCRVSEHIVWCKAEFELFQTKSMRKLVADLYAHMFLFLSDTMDWITEKRRKRLLDSSNEKFLKRFEDQITDISQKAVQVRKLGEQSSHAEVRVTRLTTEQLAADVRIGLQGHARYQAEMRYFREAMERELREAGKERQQLIAGQQQLVVCLKNMLQEGAMVSIRAKESAYIPLQLPDPATIDPEASQGTYLTAEDVFLNSRDLEDFFHRDRVLLPGDPTKPVMVNQEVLARLVEWTESTVSPLLWLEGPYTEADDFENPMSEIATVFIRLAEKSRVPVISYFCELRRNENLQPGNSMEAQATVSLVYPLVRQMIEQLLPRFDTDFDLSHDRFRRLDGTLSSLTDALSILHDLLDLASEGVFCVIDGLQWLDDRSTDNHLKEFVQVLRASKLKVLFTTTARSACLLEEMSTSETFLVDMLHESEADLGLERHEFWTQ